MSTILLADDNSNIQKMVALALKDQGIEVVAVGNGEAAVRKLRDMVPDLVLADIFMPVRNGYEVCEFVKADTRLSHVPVVLLAGAFDPFDQNEAERVGANGVLKKPFVPPDPLVNLVKSLLPKPPDPPPPDPVSGEFVSNRVANTWGLPLPSQAFAGTSMPPNANAPFAAPVAVVNPPGTQPGQPMASAPHAAQPKPKVKEEFPEPMDDPSLTQVTRPDLLDEMLGRGADAKEGNAAKGRFGGVAAFPDLVEGDGPKAPEKNKFAPKTGPPGSFGDRQWEESAEGEEQEEEVEVERPKSFRPSFLDKVDEATIETKPKTAERKGAIELPKGLNFPAATGADKETPVAKSEATAQAEKPAASASSKISWPSLDQAMPPQTPAVKTETKAAEPKAEEPKAAEPVAAAPTTFETAKPEPAIGQAEKIEESQPQEWNSYSSVAAELDAHESEKAEAQASAPINVSPWLPRPTPSPSPEPAAKAQAPQETVPAKPIVIPRGADEEILNTVKAVMEETAASVDNFGKQQPVASGSARIETETKAEAKAENVQTPTVAENVAAITESATTAPVEATTSNGTTSTPEKASTQSTQSEHSDANLVGGAKDMATAEGAPAGPVVVKDEAQTPAQGERENELVSEISARVMERMRPQVIDVITKEILRPIVEALVKKEIEEK